MLLGRFSSIIYFSSEHDLFVYIVKQTFLKIRSSLNLPWGHARSHKKCVPNRFSHFDVYWIQTEKQTPRQAKCIYRLPSKKNFMYTSSINLKSLFVCLSYLLNKSLIKTRLNRKWSYFVIILK